MKFDRQIKLLVQVLRGSKSQMELSQEVGFSYNIVHRWESGTKKLSWGEFVDLCRSSKVDLQTCLIDLCGLEPKVGIEGAKIIDFFLQDSSAKHLLKDKFSSQKLRRLAVGATQLTLNDFLIVVEVLTGRAQRFLDLVSGGQVQAAPVDEYKRSYAEEIAKDPRLTLVNFVLGLKGYKDLAEHSDAYISSLTGMSEVEVRKGLALLMSMGVISREKSHFVPNFNYVDSRVKNNPEYSRQIPNYWRSKISTYCDPVNSKGTKRVRSAYLMYASNEDTDKELFELTNRFYLEFRNIVMKNEKSDLTSVKYLGIDFFNPLEEPPK